MVRRQVNFMDVVSAMWILCIFALMSTNICEAIKGVKAGKHGLREHHNHENHHNHDDHHCYTAEEGVPSTMINRFASRKMNWNNYITVKLVSNIENSEGRDGGKRRRKREQGQGCPINEFAANRDEVKDRSISPWEYRIDTDETRYPQKLAFAHCLCKGCIHTHGTRVSENHSLVSVPVEQTMLVLRRKTCAHDKSKYTFEVDYINVPVACTCAKPRY
ncbi:interleukin-17C [Pelobates fuscus]|uniref:interleukin-17C n=1 Tax=Pelobates fuscus TaxID=191477 RepID=UPI002FE461A7